MQVSSSMVDMVIFPFLCNDVLLLYSENTAVSGVGSVKVQKAGHYSSPDRMK